MRLNEFDPNSINVEDQRGGRFPMGRGGKVGCGSIIIALIAALVFGVDPAQMLGGMQEMQETTQQPQALPGGQTAAESCNVNEFSKESCAHMASLNETWAPIFKRAGAELSQPKLVFYSQAGQSGCGAAQSAMGPFYCPSDNGIYIDTDFYNEMDQKLGAAGDFARAYVMAHEYGHHVQTLTGMSDQVRSLQQQNPSQANALQVRMELQADCYAGVWAAHNKDRIEPGDIEEGLNAAHSIGDDTLMRNAGQRPVEAAFTHGTSEQRMQWLRKGLETGDEDQCDTFADMRR
jgi:predicted metalloprotease